MTTTSYQIKLPEFEGPFDLLLFFIERDELDIYNIPITKITNDFLDYIHGQDGLNIEMGSEFILFISTLMRIKAKMLLPRKEVDASGAEIDPRQELVDKILEYKRFKEASIKMAELESTRMQMVKRGNLEADIASIGEEAGEGTEIQAITLFKLMKAFEKVMKRVQARNFKPQHVVMQYNYTMEGTRDYVLHITKQNRTVGFDKIFEVCENRVHALFLFLSVLELCQQQFMMIITGEGRNNFVVEWNNERPADVVDLFTIVAMPPNPTLN